MCTPENPQDELTEAQYVYIRYHFAKWLCWNDAGLSPLDYIPQADALVQIVKDALYYHRENL